MIQFDVILFSQRSAQKRKPLIACAVRCALWFCFVSQFTPQCNNWGEKF